MSGNNVAQLLSACRRCRKCSVFVRRSREGHWGDARSQSAEERGEFEISDGLWSAITFSTFNTNMHSCYSGKLMKKLRDVADRAATSDYFSNQLILSINQIKNMHILN